MPITEFDRTEKGDALYSEVFDRKTVEEFPTVQVVFILFQKEFVQAKTQKKAERNYNKLLLSIYDYATEALLYFAQVLVQPD
uniref:Uncharacterized protein n=1 Tax=Arundo donax TaxID=35708 RepID=A0A0A8ZGH9_ARUDO